MFILYIYRHIGICEIEQHHQRHSTSQGYQEIVKWQANLLVRMLSQHCEPVCPKDEGLQLLRHHQQVNVEICQALVKILVCGKEIYLPPELEF